MTKQQQQVHDFMLKAQQECHEQPTVPMYNTIRLRCDLIQEELHELIDSFDLISVPDPFSVTPTPPDLTKVADALGDLLVVVLGTAVSCGIDMEPIFEEIHRSNMSKFIDGYMRPDGKWMKGPAYSPANLKPLLDAQTKKQ